MGEIQIDQLIMERGGPQHSRVGKDFDHVLAKIYNGHNQGSYSGIDALYKAAKPKLPDLTLADVSQFLHKQNVYTSHKNVNRNFRRRLYISSRPGAILGIDLLFIDKLRPYNYNYGILLTATDFFTR